MNLLRPSFEQDSVTLWVATEMSPASMNMVMRHASDSQARDQ